MSLITRGFGGGNIILRGFGGLVKRVVIKLRETATRIGKVAKEISKKISVEKLIEDITSRIKKRAREELIKKILSRIKEKAPPEEKIKKYPCPFCKFRSKSLLKLTRHIRKSHPDALLQYAKLLPDIAMKYRDIEVLILPPKEEAPESIDGKPLIATEMIKIKVRTLNE